MNMSEKAKYYFHKIIDKEKCSRKNEITESHKELMSQILIGRAHAELQDDDEMFETYYSLMV